MKMPSVKVFIPIYNPPESFDDLLLILLKQINVEVKIQLVDSSKNRFHKNIESERIDLLNIEPKDFNHALTRNLALQDAEAFDVIVFMTQDIEISDTAMLVKLISPIINGSAEASYARQIARKNLSYFDYIEREINYPACSSIKSKGDIKLLGMKTYFFSNAASAVRSSSFSRNNGFPAKTIMNEDMLYAHQLIQNGERIAYVSESIVYHTHVYSLKQISERYFDHGVFFRQNKEKFDNLSASEGGFNILMKQLSLIYRDKKLNFMPRWFALNLIKLLSYKMGMYYQKLPRNSQIYFSMHKRYWERR